MMVTVALTANNSPTSVTLAPKERVSKVERIPDEPSAMFKGIIARYHGIFDFSTRGGSVVLTEPHPFISITSKIASKLRFATFQKGV